MLRIIFTLLVVITISPSLRAETDDDLEKSCLASSGLSCAKLAYQYRKKGDLVNAHKFYEKGCNLQDESSCFNMKGINPQSIFFQKADGIMKFHAQNMSNCHRPQIKNKYSQMQIKEKWNRAILDIHIDADGMADKVTIKTNLNSTFIDCVTKIVKKIQYPKPEGLDPSYNYELTLISGE